MTLSSLKKNMMWNAAGNLLYMGCQWVITVLVTVIGGLYDAGILSVAMSVSAACQTLAMFGIRNFQVSDIDGQYSDTCYVALRVLTCAATVPVCLVFCLCSGYLGAQLLAVLLFLLFRLAECFSDVLHGIAQKRERLDIAGKAFAIKGIGLLITFLAGYLLSGKLNVGLACMAVFSCATTLLYDLLAVRQLSRFSFFIGFSETGKLALETLPLCIYLFLSAAITTAPKLILEKECGEAVLGAYSSVFAPAMLLQAATVYLYMPFATRLASLHQGRDRAGFLRLLARIAVALLGIFAVVVVLAYFFGEFALVLVFGEKLRPYIEFLMPILAVNLMISYMGLFSMAVIVLRKFRFLLAGHAVGFLMAILLPSPAIARFGANGTSYALIAAGFAVSAILIAGILWCGNDNAVKESKPI